MAKPSESGRSESRDDLEQARDERRFRLIAEAIPHIVWTTSPDGHCDYQNHRWTDYSGMSAEESSGIGWMEAVHPDDLDRCRPSPSNVPGEAQSIAFEYRLRRLDGEYRWFEARAEPICDDEGKVVRWFGTSTDIHDRKRLEEETRRRDIEWLRLVDHSPAGLYLFDIQARKTIETRGTPLPSLGYTLENLAALGEDLHARIMHPDDLVRFLEHLEVLKTLPDKVVMGFEYRMRHVDSSWRWFLSRDAVYERDEAGTPRLIIGAALDVTDRRRWQDELHASEQKFRAIFENAAVGMVQVGLDGKLLRVNDRLCAILGRERDELVGLNFQALTHPDDLATNLELAARLASDEIPTYTMEKRYLRKDGSITWANLTVGLLRDESGRPDSFISVVEGIDDRKANEARLRLGLQAGGLALMEIDHIHDTAHLSPEALEAFGLPGSDPVVPRATIHKRFHPDDLEALEQATARCLDPGGNGWFAMEHRIIRPDGEVRWHSVRKQVTFGLDAEGRSRPVRALLAMRDVTDAKRAEQDLRDADRRKDEFLAILAHEFRNPLAAIRNSLRLLNLPDLSEDDRASAIEVSDRQSSNLVRLIDDLLDVSRISTGKIQLRREPLDAATIVERVAASVGPSLKVRRHELTVVVAPGPMPIEGDPTRLEQILANLLQNAGKYTNEGGKIHLDARVEGREVVVRVVDNGMGIDRAMLSKVFELFEQVDSSLDRAQGGLGIGLTLVKRLAEMHGGRVSAASEGPGLGSEFTVRLPLRLDVPGSAREPVGGLASKAPTLPRCRQILLVDDNADTIRSMARLLEISGHQVVRQSDGPSAIEAAGRQEFDFIILDIGLPGMSGHEVAETLLRDQQTRAVLIALSGYAQDKDRERSKAAGFSHHLSKPVDLDALLDLIENDRRGLD